MQFVLIHGGTFDERCWERVSPLLDLPAVAIRQPGRRGFREDEIDTLTRSDYRANVAARVAELEGDLILVAHSLAGVSVDAGYRAAPDRVKHVVLVSAAIPPVGKSVITMRETTNVAATAAQANTRVEPDRGHVNNMCGGLSDAELDRVMDLTVTEPSAPVVQPVSGEYQVGAPQTWIRLTRDPIFKPELQTSIAKRIGVERVVDLESGHLPMFTHPRELAELLNEIAARC